MRSGGFDELALWILAFDNRFGVFGLTLRQVAVFMRGKRSNPEHREILAARRRNE